MILHPANPEYLQSIDPKEFDMTANEFVPESSTHGPHPANAIVMAGAKRIMDLAISITAILILSPVFIIVTLAVKLSSKGPVFFYQRQFGKGKIDIFPLKFRTMYLNSEDRLMKLISEDKEIAEEYRKFHKLKADPRVTPVGRFLRKSSLDEIPQFFNVLAGSMSIVGPRPYLPRELGEMEGLENRILQVKPGITGYWQVEGRNNTTFAERLQMDIHYVEKWCLSWDVSLFFKTILAVFLRKGAY